MPTRNVNLTDHYDSPIAAGIEAGRNGNASEAVRAALRLEQQEQEDTRPSSTGYAPQRKK